MLVKFGWLLRFFNAFLQTGMLASLANQQLNSMCFAIGIKDWPCNLLSLAWNSPQWNPCSQAPALCLRENHGRSECTTRCWSWSCGIQWLGDKVSWRDHFSIEHGMRQVHVPPESQDDISFCFQGRKCASWFSRPCFDVCLFAGGSLATNVLSKTSLIINHDKTNR